MKIKFFQQACLLLFLLLAAPVNALANDVLNALFHNANDPIMGNPRGDVIIVEFFDYQCGHCSSMAKTLATVVKSYPNVKLVLKDYPIRGEASTLAAKAALAANLQGKYSALYYGLLNTQYELTESTILTIAKQHGVNINQLKEDMESESVAKQLNANKELGSYIGVPGTPVLLIGKSNTSNPKEVIFIPGKVGMTEMKEAIEQLNKRVTTGAERDNKPQ